MGTTSRTGRLPPVVTVLGAVFVLLGIVLLADSTGTVEIDAAFDFVPSVFVVVGLLALVRSGFRNFLGPVLVVLFATAWQLTTLDLVAGEDLVALWPLVLVVFGLSLLLGRRRAAVRTVEDDWPALFAVFGGNERRVASKAFEGADLTALFGGVELDLRDAAVPNPPARVAATALFGGVEVVVPRDWRVEVDVLPVLGAATDERPRRPEEHETVDLVVTGFAAFGGVTVTD